MKKKLSRGILTLDIIGLCFYILFFVSLFLICVVRKLDLPSAFFDILSKEIFSIQTLKNLFTPQTGDMSSAFNIASYVIFGLVLIGLIVGIIISIRKKRKALIPGLIAIVLLLIPVSTFMNSGDVENSSNALFIFNHLFLEETPIVKVFVALYLASLIFSISTSLGIYILGMMKVVTESKKIKLAVAPKIEEEPAEIPEEIEPQILVQKQAKIMPEINSEEMVFAELEEEPLPEEELEENLQDEIPEPVMKEDKRKLKPEVNEDNTNEEEETEVYDETDLRELLKGIIRDAVKEELDKRNITPQAPVASNGQSPIIVQYFNAPVPNGQNIPQNQQMYPPFGWPYGYPYPQQPQPTAQPAPQQPQPEPQPVEQPVPVAESVEVNEVIEPVEPVKAPVKPEQKPKEKKKEEAPTGDEEEGGSPVRIPFTTRILEADKEIQALYNELKNELLSYGLKSRVAAGGDTFRLHCKTYCKMSVSGKSLKLHLALDPKDYADSKMPFSDAGDKAIYADIPFVFKVKSGLSLRRAKDLIADCVAKDDLIQEDIGTVNWVKEIKANLK